MSTDRLTSNTQAKHINSPHRANSTKGDLLRAVWRTSLVIVNVGRFLTEE